MISQKRNHTQLAHTRKFEMKITAVAILILASISTTFADGEQCGRQAGGAICPNNYCCSSYGFCGWTDAYCGVGCQSNCIAGRINSSEFETMLLHRNDERCEAHGFYTYDAFVAASNAFPDFGTTGIKTSQKRDIAAFFAHTFHDTDGWPQYGADVVDEKYEWGYCFFLPPPWAVQGSNRKYGVVLQDATVSFQKAISFWMAEQPPKPSCHTAMNGEWKPMPGDGLFPGFGLTINIITRGKECVKGDHRAENRIGFYKRFCDILDVKYGENVDCKDQPPYPPNVGRSVGNNIYMQ